MRTTSHLKTKNNARERQEDGARVACLDMCAPHIDLHKMRKRCEPPDKSSMRLKTYAIAESCDRWKDLNACVSRKLLKNIHYLPKISFHSEIAQMNQD